VTDKAERFTQSDIEFIIQLAQEREGWVSQMKAALKAGKTEEALKLARRVCGLSDSPEPREMR